MMMVMNASQQQQASPQAAPNKAQKGWLSRWTRRQWSRHWFVLKNGSLTYYRGPAAELCSFLDGVLDLSLIKHIELGAGQPPTPSGPQPGHHLSAGSAGRAEQQFTFTLQMWNGECHQLGAPSEQERQLWLQAINVCMNGDDEASIDSASSSDSAGCSSAAGRAKQQQLAHEQLALKLQAAAGRPREQPEENSSRLVTRLQRQEGDAEAKLNLKQQAAANKTSSHEAPSSLKEAPEVLSSRPGELSSEQRNSWQQSQAFKRRLLCLQARRQESQLIAHARPPASLFAPLEQARPSSSSSDSSSTSSFDGEEPDEEDEEDHHEDPHGQRDGHDQAEPAAGSKASCLGRQANLMKQKKRVTFDLSKCSHHQLSDPSSDSDSSLSSSASALSSSSERSAEELCHAHEAAMAHEEEGEREDQAHAGEPARSPGMDTEELPTLDRKADERLPLAGQPEEILDMDTSVAPAGESQPELEFERQEVLRKLGQKVDLLESKLSDSQASYGKLEENYKRLQGEMLNCDELHKGELSRLQAKVEELTHELARNELQLREAHEKLLRVEEQVSKKKTHHQQHQENSYNRCMELKLGPRAFAGNWLKARNQQQHQSAGLQPLLLSMQHGKQQMAVNQQALSLKLLNHSKQIQRKLNELELKVDRIHGSRAEAGEANGDESAGVA